MSVPSLPEGAVLRVAQSASPVTIDDLAPPGRLLIVAPHPDDETLGCGMAFAAALAAGREVAILLLTDGEGSHPNSRKFDPESRVAIRKAEFETALATLTADQPIQVVRTSLPDGRTTDRDAAKVIDELLRHRCIVDAHAIWSTWAHDPHCDHRTAAILARMLAERIDAGLWSFPVWGRFGERPVPPDCRLFSDNRHRQAKRAAMEAYASQMTNLIDDDPHGFVMPPDLFDHFATHPEIFFHER